MRRYFPSERTLPQAPSRPQSVVDVSPCKRASGPQAVRPHDQDRVTALMLFHTRSLKGLSDADIAALQRLVDDQVEENLGMAMIYTIIAAAQEWLRDKVRPLQHPGVVCRMTTKI